MDGKNDADALPATAWHPLFALAIERFAPNDRQTSTEVSLSRLPQRVDIVVVQRDGVAPAMAHKLHSIFDHLRKHTLIEYKGVTDDLEATDVFTLVAYAGLYMRERGVVEPNEMCLMVVAERIPLPFIQQVQRMAGVFNAAGNGLFKGHLCGLPLHGVELREAYKSGPSEQLFYIFTRAFLNQSLLEGPWPNQTPRQGRDKRISFDLRTRASVGEKPSDHRYERPRPGRKNLR